LIDAMRLEGVKYFFE